MNARHARRIRRGIDRARSDAAQGLPGLLVSTDELEQAAYRRTRARYARARFVGWKVPLPPVPPSKYRGLRWINPARRGRL